MQEPPDGRLLGHLDATGMLDVEGPGSKLLVQDAARIVDADSDAAAVRAEAVRHGGDDLRAMTEMRDVLLQLAETAKT